MSIFKPEDFNLIGKTAYSFEDITKVAAVLANSKIREYNEALNTKLESTMKQNEILMQALKFYAEKHNWNENNVDMRDWYLIESNDRGDKAREALVKVGGGLK